MIFLIMATLMHLQNEVEEIKLKVNSVDVYKWKDTHPDYNIISGDEGVVLHIKILSEEYGPNYPRVLRFIIDLKELENSWDLVTPLSAPPGEKEEKEYYIMPFIERKKPPKSPYDIICLAIEDSNDKSVEIKGGQDYDLYLLLHRKKDKNMSVDEVNKLKDKIEIISYRLKQ